MKKLFTTLLLFSIASLSYGQMHVGETLNDIKTEYSYGTLELSKETPIHYTYAVVDATTKDFYVYFLDVNLNCYLSVVNPSTSTRLQGWVESLGKQWVVVDRFHWRYYEQDGTVMVATLERVDEVGLCISFRYEQK